MMEAGDVPRTPITAVFFWSVVPFMVV